MHEQQPFLYGSDGPWIPIKDGDPTAMALFLWHYSARQDRKIYQFVGPGEKMVLMTQDALGLFVWRKFISDAGERGVNCAVFRNEGSSAGKASVLIKAAMRMAWIRWPGDRLYTYVDPSKVRLKDNPGHCFIIAGFRFCGTTKGGLLVFEAFPESL